MGFIVSTPTYMYQSPSGYIFRIRIPADLRGVVGKCEFRYSLRSRLLREAEQRARSIAAFIHQLFIRVRNNMAEFTSEQISASVRQYVKKTLQNDERCRSFAEPSMEDKTMLEASGMKSGEAESLLMSVNRWLKNNDHELMYPVTRKILSEQEGGIDESSETFKTLSRELLKGFKDILRVRIKRAEGDYSQPDEELIPALKEAPVSESQQSVTIPSKATKQVKISDVQARYVAEAEKTDRWADKTHGE